MASTLLPKRRAADPATDDQNAGASPAAAPAVPTRNAAAITSNAERAYSNARNAISAPLPRTGPMKNASASITLEDGRTITRSYSGAGYTQDVSAPTRPGAAPLTPELTAPMGNRFEGYSQDDVTRIAGDRKNFAAAETARGDKLLAPITGVANTSQVREAGQIANDTARENLDQQKLLAPLTAKEREAKINEINAGAAAKAQGIDQLKVIQKQYDDATQLHDQDRRAWLTERAQLTSQLKTLQDQLTKQIGTPKPADAATGPALNFNENEVNMLTGRPAGKDAKGNPTPAQAPIIDLPGMQALKRGQYGSPATRPTSQPSAGAGGAAQYQPITQTDLPANFSATLTAKGLKQNADGTVTDQAGRVLQLVKDASGRIQAVSASSGQPN